MGDIYSLPQSKGNWYFTTRRLRAWIMDEDKQPFRPHLTVIVDLEKGMILSSEVGMQLTQAKAQELLIKAMSEPEKDAGLVPQRPGSVLFEERAWLEALGPFLREIGVQSKYRSMRELSNEIFASFEEHLTEGAPEIPGLFSIKGVNQKMAASLFAAAADFYDSEPWIKLANEDVLAITITTHKEPWYAIVMGQGGVEYGLALYKSWEDVERQYSPMEGPEEFISPSGHHALFFNEITEVPFDDLDALEKYGWKLAAPDAYPVPLVFTSLETVARPDRETLLWYETVLRAIPRFVSEHLVDASPDQSQPIDARLQVSTASGKVWVNIKYPGGKLPKGARGLHEPELIDFLEPEERLFDLRAMEGEMARITAGMREDAPVNREVGKAQDLMYQAWAERNPAKRIAIAHQALKTSADCADAYVLLAEEEASDANHSLELFRQGVEAGKRALGEEFFEENEGHFWGMLETRPYMRAMEGMAYCLEFLDHDEDAQEIYCEMLRLNPGDNQGVRYNLVALLLKRNLSSELETLLDEYKQDWSSVWTYTKALLEFSRHGDTPKARKALSEALEQNAHVPDYFSGAKRVPNRLPETIGMGDEREAMDYAAIHLNFWRRTPGAVNWLKARAKVKPVKKKKKFRKIDLTPGDSVVVKPGVTDLDDDSDLGGWQGRVVEIVDGETGQLVLVAWDGPTMQGLKPEYISSAMEEGTNWSEYFLYVDEVTKTKVRDTPEERQGIYEHLAARYAWAHLGEQGKRIQAVIQGVDRGDEAALYRAWDVHLRENMKLPLEAKIAEPAASSRLRVDERVQIVEFVPLDEKMGVMVRVQKGKRSEVVSLFTLEPEDEDTPSGQLLEDYITWYLDA